MSDGVGRAATAAPSEPARLIAFLNAIHVGEMGGIRTKLDAARDACLSIEQRDLALRLEEARDALLGGDLRTYRRRIETVVARLGHLR